MANTAITGETILLNPTEAGVQVVEGYLHEDTYPGQWVMFDAANNEWDLLDSDTASHLLIGAVGVVGYKKRVNQTTGALKTITDAWDISEAEDKRAPIITSGFVKGYIADQGKTLECGHFVIPSATGGTVTLTAAQTGVASLAHIVVDDDTRAIFGLGAFIGRIWSGSGVT